MSATTLRTPSYRHHKPSGQAVVTLEGRDIYLGRYGLFLTVYSSIFLQNRGLRNHRGGVAPGAVSLPGADGSTC
jgi:hypothetical protein